MADIFISHKKRADYKFVIPLEHDEVITISGDSFKQSN